LFGLPCKELSGLYQRAQPPVVAPAPQRVAEHSLAAPGLLAQLLVSKYCDHLPFYRQEQIFWQRQGVFIARQQMVQWTEQSVRLLLGITDCLKGQFEQSPYVQGDETPLRYQDPNLAGRCGQGYLPSHVRRIAVPKHPTTIGRHLCRRRSLRLKVPITAKAVT
jgi:hypothetical protein